MTVEGFLRDIKTKWGLPHQSAAGPAPLDTYLPPGLDRPCVDACGPAPPSCPRPPPGLELLRCRMVPPSLEDYCGKLTMSRERTTGDVCYDPKMDIAAKERAVANFDAIPYAIKAQSDTKKDVTSSPSNPGSMGHPNFCRRICHHHVMGKCVNGDSCNFCHMPHLKRPMRLDKKHRQKLADMSFCDFTTLIFPVIKKKMRGLNSCAELDHLIRELEDHIRLFSAAAAKITSGGVITASNGIVWDARAGKLLQNQACHGVSEDELKRRNQFSSMLSAMDLRTLLAMVIRMTPPEMAVLRSLLVQAREIIFEQNGASHLHRDSFACIEM